METAMQSLINEIKLIEAYPMNPLVLRIATELLKKEKEQIIEAVNYGNKQDHYDATEIELSNYYYNETYNQK